MPGVAGGVTGGGVTGTGAGSFLQEAYRNNASMRQVFLMIFFIGSIFFPPAISAGGVQKQLLNNNTVGVSTARTEV